MVSFELSDAVAVVRLDGNEGMSPPSNSVLDGLHDAFMRAAREPGVRACLFVCTGEGASGEEVYAAARTAGGRVQEVSELIERSSVPVIATVDGPVAGACCKLVLACHLRVASTRARFELAEIGRGALAGSESLTAEEAYGAGLVCRLTSPEQLGAQAQLLARTIAQLAPLAVGACLEAVTRGMSLSLEEGLDLEARLFSGLFATEDMREGTRAFLEKRAPVFKGN